MPVDEKAQAQLDDLRETRRRGIEESGGRGRRAKRRGCGCGVLVALAILVAIIIFFFQDIVREKVPEDLNTDVLRQSFQGLLEKGQSVVSKPPDGILEDLRTRASSIQGDWNRLIESGEARRKVEALHDELQTRRDAAGEAGGEIWRQTIEKTDAILESLGDKKTDALRQLRELDKALEEMQRHLPRTESTPSGNPRNDDGQ